MTLLFEPPTEGFLGPDDDDDDVATAAFSFASVDSERDHSRFSVDGDSAGSVVELVVVVVEAFVAALTF